MKFGKWVHTMDIILASASPRREQLLRQLGLSFTLRAAELDEESIQAETPAALVEALASAKASLVAKDAPADSLIIAADTLVVRGAEILGKPKDAADARRMLAALSGREHLVYTGLALLENTPARRLRQSHAVTRVRFRTLSPAEIAAYVQSGEPMDKAGAYGIQEFGALLVESIAGDYFNVVGLPLCLLGQLLSEFGLNPLLLAAGGEEAGYETEGISKEL